MEKARGANGFEAHAGVLICCHGREQRKGVGDAIAPIAQHTGGGGAGVRIRRAQHALEQVDIDNVVPLVDPKRFREVMLIRRVLCIELAHPFFQCGDDFAGIVFV